MPHLTVPHCLTGGGHAPLQFHTILEGRAYPLNSSFLVQLICEMFSDFALQTTMDQIVFIIDLEEVVPIGKVVGEQDENLREARLHSIKEAALKMVLSCLQTSKFSESKWDLPSMGLR